MTDEYDRLGNRSAGSPGAPPTTGNFVPATADEFNHDAEHARVAEHHAAMASNPGMAGEAEHTVDWSGTHRGTESDPRESGWCATCGREVYDGDGHGHVKADTILTASEASVDAELRRLGVDPVAIDERARVFVELARNNAALREEVAALREVAEAARWVAGTVVGERGTCDAAYLDDLRTALAKVRP